MTPIHDLFIKGTDLIAATHGRAFWILDDLSPLHQVQPGQESASATLYEPRDAVRFRTYDRSGYASQTPGYASYNVTGPVTVAYRNVERSDGSKTQNYLNAGKNPPLGVIIHYAFATKPEGEVTLAILDKDGNELRSYSSENGKNGKNGKRIAADAGANRFVWDLRFRPITPLDDDPKKDDPMAQQQEAGLAPRALPGSYSVRLTVGDTVITQPFTVLPDPRLPVTADELRQQFELKAAIRDRADEVNRAINDIRRVRKQLGGWEERAKLGAGGDQAGQIAERAKQLQERLAAVEGEFVNPAPDKPQPGSNRLREKLMTLSSMIDESDDAPTKGAREVYAVLAEQVAERRRDLDRLLAEEVAAFNGMIQSAGLPAVEA